MRRAAVVPPAVFCALYYALLRRPVLTWGATEAEATSRLPGAELLEDADGISTHGLMASGTHFDTPPREYDVNPASASRNPFLVGPGLI